MTGAGSDVRRVLVLGGGLGHRLAYQALGRGHRTLAISPVTPSKLRVDHISMDLGATGDWARAVEAGCVRLGGVEVLITCPTIKLHRVPITEVPDDDWFAAMSETMLCPLAACNRGLDLLRSGSTMVHLTAIRPTPVDPTLAPASAAFTAVQAMIHALSGPAAIRGVTVFGVAPARHRDPLPPPITARMPLLALEDGTSVVDRLLDLIDQPPESGTTVQMLS